MGKDFHDITQSVSRSLRGLRADIPGVTSAFAELASAATADGALDRKTKELIALALSVAARCDSCIGFHVQALARAGATRQEVAETLGMAVYMGGGPSLMYAAEAVAAWDQHTEAERSRTSATRRPSPA